MTQRVDVLIADNRQAIRQGLKAIMAQYPQICIVGEASNGKEAVELVSARQPDVVLMDMQMPVMDGVAATRYIKRSWPDVRIIALTMYSATRTQALAAGADAFLLKGCASELLLDAILQGQKVRA